MLKHKSIGSLAAAAIFCMDVLLSPVASSADTSGGLTLTVAPSVTTASLGENVSYNYVITSTCNTTVSSLVLTDDKLGTISLPATSINTGENITVNVARTVVSGDFPGPVVNTATVTGIAADNTSLSASASVSVKLVRNTGNHPGDNLTPPGDNWTKLDWLKFKGVPGKGILHAPGLLKPFNPNSHWGNWESDNNTGRPGNGNNDKGQGPYHKNGKDRNKANGNH